MATDKEVIAITERPVDSCKIKDGKIVHVEYLTERTTVEMIRGGRAMNLQSLTGKLIARLLIALAALRMSGAVRAIMIFVSQKTLPQNLPLKKEPRMSLLGRIFDFIKGLFTRPGLNDFLHKYQSKAIEVIEHLATVNSGKALNVWWDDAFAQFKTLVQADIQNVHDNWLTIALSLAYEIYKAEKAGHQA